MAEQSSGAHRPSISAARYRDALAAYPGGVTIVTSANAARTPAGVTVSAFAALSLEPPLVMVGLSKGSRTMTVIHERGAFAVHVLTAEHAALARRFATDGTDKFAGLAVTWAPSGVPLLRDCPHWIECVVDAEHAGGDHVILVGRVVGVPARPARPAGASGGSNAGLVYHQRVYRALGERAG